MPARRFSTSPASASAQASLFGDDTASHEIHRLFFALMPDEPAIAAIGEVAARLRAAHSMRGKPILPARYHATLNFLGDNDRLRPDWVERAGRAAGRVRVEPCEVRLDRACVFQRRGGASPCVLKGPADDALMALWSTLRRELVVEGFGKELDHAFVPHVTWIYSRDGFPEQAIEPIRWSVRDFVLVHSIVHDPEYRILGRWALTSGPGNVASQHSQG
jgi:2'-5' RNA ligase